MASYDILIKSGLVLDGEKKAPFSADIGIKKDKIAAVGNLGKSQAGLTIDAEGKYVTPGFIDLTNHSDTHLALFRFPSQESLLMQGVTTAFGGSCGGSLAPLTSKQALYAIRKWVNPADINTNWSSMAEFLAELEKLKPGINFGTFVGYGTLRRNVIGDEARELNREEKNKIKFLLNEAIEAGAWGLSLGLIYGHERISSTDEIVEIVEGLRDRGIVKMHLRSEGKNLVGSVNEAVRIAREAQVSVEINHLKAIGRGVWKELPKALKIIETARRSGVNINYDVSPYHTTGSPLYSLIPPWARRGGFNELFKRLDDDLERQKIIQELKNYTLHFDKLFIISSKFPFYQGHTLAELAEEGGISPEEALVEVVRSNEGRVFILGKTISAKNVKAEIEDPNSFVASNGEGYSQEIYKSGNLTHPRSFGTFPHFWHKYVEGGKLRPAEAIKKITSGPADKVGLKGRGRIKEKNFADIAIFDPKLFRDRATYKNPFRYPAGIEWVIVNGKVAVQNGKLFETRQGKVLRNS